MPFHPKVNDTLAIDGISYRITEHPSAPGMPYGQEGRQAVVYQLLAEGGGKRALKVFKARYRVPGLVSISQRLSDFADLPALKVCRRTVLTPQRHGDVLQQHVDLTYAVLMPWVEGPTWMQVVLDKRPLTAEQSLALARTFADVLARMEQENLAHCDLSASNLLLPMLAGGEGVALVDVEQMYGPDLRRPHALPSGSPGYAHKTAPDGLWSLDADRFAGAVMLAEMLGWCDARVRDEAWGENYFAPNEMQTDCERFHVLGDALRERWGDGVVGLMGRAWRSELLQDCATFGEWMVMLPVEVGSEPPSVQPVETASIEPTRIRLPQPEGDPAETLAHYEGMLSQTPKSSALHSELELIVISLQGKIMDAGLAGQGVIADQPPGEAVDFAQEQTVSPEVSQVAEGATEVPGLDAGINEETESVAEPPTHELGTPVLVEDSEERERLGQATSEKGEPPRGASLEQTLGCELRAAFTERKVELVHPTAESQGPTLAESGTEPQLVEPVARTGTGRKRKRRWIWVIAALALLVAGGSGWALYSYYNDSGGSATYVTPYTYQAKPTAIVAALPDAVVTHYPGVNLRAGPGEAYDVLDNYPQGAELEVLGKSPDGKWLKVRAQDGEMGWMWTEYLQLNVPVADIPYAPIPAMPTATAAITVPPTPAAPPPPEPTPVPAVPEPPPSPSAVLIPSVPSASAASMSLLATIIGSVLLACWQGRGKSGR